MQIFIFFCFFLIVLFAFFRSTTLFFLSLLLGESTNLKTKNIMLVSGCKRSVTWQKTQVVESVRLSYSLWYNPRFFDESSTIIVFWSFLIEVLLSPHTLIVIFRKCVYWKAVWNWYIRILVYWFCYVQPQVRPPYRLLLSIR